MAYKLMKALINMRKPVEELTRKCNVYYAAGQLTDDQYAELMGIINAM